MNRKAIDRISLVIYLLSIIIFTVIFRTVRSFLVTVLISTSVLLVYLTYSKYKYTKSTRIKDYSNILMLLVAVLCLIYIAISL